MNTIDKKHTYRAWKYLRAINIWYLTVAFVCMLGVTGYALRHNNQRMIELRNAVYVADKDGGDIEGALRDLRTYVYRHMNTNLNSGKASVYPPIQLKYTYERLLSAQQEEVKQQNEQIYTEAQRECERLHPESYSGGARVPCIRDYVANKGIQTKDIPDSVYKFDFVSPVWSPDVAGISLVMTVLVGLLLAIRVAVPRVLKKLRVI